MPFDTHKTTQLVQQIDLLLNRIRKKANQKEAALMNVQPKYALSAQNLVYYHSFREGDLRDIQNQLRDLGLTRFANAAGHIEASLLNSRFVLQKILDIPQVSPPKADLPIERAIGLLKERTSALLGPAPAERRVRIMVTLPRAVAFEEKLAHRMVEAGMDCARINCAHDDPRIWEMMIAHIKKAAAKVGRPVKIAMDLAGPKIRTGSIEEGPRVRKFNPVRDDAGRILKPAIITLVAEEDYEPASKALPVSAAWLNKLMYGDLVELKDTRGKKRQLRVVEVEKRALQLNTHKTTYIGTGTKLKCGRESVGTAVVGNIAPIQQVLRLKPGDELLLMRENKTGKPAVRDPLGQIIRPARISCTMPQLFDRMQSGTAILFDDGKIRGEVQEVCDDHALIRIVRAKFRGTKLGPDKGINLPGEDLKITGLTDKDRQDLQFVARHADIANFSFVNSSEDVREIRKALVDLDALNRLGVILKIETDQAYRSLRTILIEAMSLSSFGVMIARGDLAVETGWENIGRVQSEILSYCAAAHIPVVWATQVLENLAKNGLPSRSEITDAVSSLKAECVMLNKGDYILDAISFLNRILSDMEQYHAKSEHMLPRLTT